MDVHRLLGDELTYELQIRGFPIGGTVKQKRDTLRGILTEERLGNSYPPVEVNIDPGYEFSVCEGKLADMDDSVNNFDVNNAKTEFRRISSRLLHLKSRLNRVRCCNSDLQAVQDSMLSWCETLKVKLNEVYQRSQNMEENVSAINWTLLDTPNTLLPDRIQSSHSENGRNGTDVEQVLVDVDGNIDHSTNGNGESNSTMLERNELQTHPISSNRVSSLRERFERISVAQDPIRDQASTSRSLPVRSDVQAPDDLFQHYSVRANSTLNSPPDSRIQQFSSSGPNHINFQLPNFVSASTLPVQMRNVPLSNPNHPLPQTSTFITPTPFQDNNSYYYEVSRWKVQYDGLSSVTNFLERVEELRLSRGVSKDRLLRSAAELFTKDALLWFRMSNFSSWDELVNKLRAAFQPHDYEYSLWEEIRRRTQGLHERVINYVSVMESLFKKLSSLPLESHRVELIRRNMLPNIQTHLALHPIANLSELIRLARAVEETDWRIQKFQPPPSNIKNLLEPELAYRKPVGLNVSAMCEDRNVAVAPVSNTAAPVCWNCSNTGHRFNKCSEPRRRFCFKCGKGGVIATQCCQKNAKRGQN